MPDHHDITTDPSRIGYAAHNPERDEDEAGESADGIDHEVQVDDHLSSVDNTK